MFPSSKLFGACPDYPCSTYNCLFSHTALRKPPPTSDASNAPVPSFKRPAAAPASQQTAPKKVARALSSGSELAKVLASETGLASSEGGGTASGGSVAGAESAEGVVANAGPPRLRPKQGLVAHTPPVTRQKMLNALYAQFLETYSPGILPTSLRHELASKHSLTQEETLFTRSTKQTYRNGVISALARLKKRSPARNVAETGTLEDEAEKLAKQVQEEKGRLTRKRVEKYVHDEEKLRIFDYMLEVPEGPGGDKETEVGSSRSCDRCKKDFIVKADLEEVDLHACLYHYGRQVTEKSGGVRQRVWSCCPSAGAPPCQVGAHVFKDEDPAVLHSRVPFILSSTLRDPSSSTSYFAPVDVAALDAELIYTTSGMSLARLTVLSASGSVLLDEHVRPPSSSTVLDLNTRFSGVKAGEVESAVLDVAGVRRALAQFVDEKTILIGHGLENDLKALRIVHKQVIDTAILFPHPNGGTWRYALRNLTKDLLGKFIQQDGPSLGHSAADDASAALELVRWKVRKDGGA